MAAAGRGSVSARLARLTACPALIWGRCSPFRHGGDDLCGGCDDGLGDGRYSHREIGESFALGGYDVTLQAVNKVEGPNYHSTMADMIVRKAGVQVASLHPESGFIRGGDADDRSCN